MEIDPGAARNPDRRDPIARLDRPVEGTAALDISELPNFFRQVFERFDAQLVHRRFRKRPRSIRAR